jgi:hypothetical protein
MGIHTTIYCRILDHGRSAYRKLFKMKHKVWELGKEDLERLASRIMNQTLRALVTQSYMYPEDATEFMKSNIPIAITPDSVDDPVKKEIFKKENLNAKCLYEIVRIK